MPAMNELPPHVNGHCAGGDRVRQIIDRMAEAVVDLFIEGCECLIAAKVSHLSSWPGIAVRRTASLPLAYVPTIHVLLFRDAKTWMPGTRPGMTRPNITQCPHPVTLSEGLNARSIARS
jgi:hypothetical protein